MRTNTDLFIYLFIIEIHVKMKYVLFEYVLYEYAKRQRTRRRRSQPRRIYRERSVCGGERYMHVGAGVETDRRDGMRARLCIR